MIRNPTHCGPKPRLSPEQIVQCKRIKIRRWKWAQRYNLPPRMSGEPTNAQLARDWGVTIDCIKRAMDSRYFGWALKHVGDV